MLHNYCVTEKCLLHFQIPDHARVVTISSIDCDFRLHSLLLKVDLTPDTKKNALLVIHVLIVLASVTWWKLELEEGSVKNPNWAGKDVTRVLPHLDLISSNFFIQGLLINLSSGCHQALHCVALLWIIISCYWNYIGSFITISGCGLVCIEWFKHLWCFQVLLDLSFSGNLWVVNYFRHHLLCKKVLNSEIILRWVKSQKLKSAGMT